MQVRGVRALVSMIKKSPAQKSTAGLQTDTIKNYVKKITATRFKVSYKKLNNASNSS